MTKAALLIFAKNPVLGKVKTRLAATIGDEAALGIYRELLLHTVVATQPLAVDKYVFYSNHITPLDIWDSNSYHKSVQQGTDLGERMKNAFAFIFTKGYQRVVIIGTDCPTITQQIITEAFDCLQHHEVVIGPAADGGYYLLGMNEEHPQFFEEMQWSSSTVLADTIGKCKSASLHYCLLPVLNDVDEEKDLHPTTL